MTDILLLNGPNLNMLGRREPELYGADSLGSIEQRLQTQAQSAGFQLSCQQSSHEGVLVERIHQAFNDKTRFILINPGGLTHTSVVLRDALLAVNIPFLEIHITNIHAREPFRQHSFLSDKAIGVIAGLGSFGYELALQFCIRHLSNR